MLCLEVAAYLAHSNCSRTNAKGLRDIIEGSLEAKLPTIWTVETQSREEAERRERLEERRGRCAKRSESRDSLRFSNDLWLRRVEK